MTIRLVQFIFNQYVKKTAEDQVPIAFEREFKTDIKNINYRSEQYVLCFDEYQTKLQQYIQYKQEFKEKPLVEKPKAILENKIELIQDVKKHALERYRELSKWFSEKRNEHNEVMKQMYESQKKGSK